MRVRLFQNRQDGMFFRDTHLPGIGRDKIPLGTHDRDEAERLGRELLAALLTGKTSATRAVSNQPVRLGELWQRYQMECAQFLDNKASSRLDASYRAPMLLGFFGRNRNARSLTPLDVMQYSIARRAGGIRYRKDGTTKGARQRTVHSDLVLLRAMLRWACTIPAAGAAPDAPRWLDRNPLDGLRFEREKNPVRPVASWERFVATRKALWSLVGSAKDEADRLRWLRLDLALVLAEATGRRRGAIVSLAWEDIDFVAETIRWRAEYDKKGIESVVPMPPALAEEIKRIRRELGVIAGRLFPSLKHAGQPMSPDILTQWLALAEKKAKQPKLAHGLWHPYRRKWASERMHLPLKAVADAGGWKDTATLLTCYQHADHATLLAVMSEPRKRSEQRRRPTTNDLSLDSSDAEIIAR